MSGQNAGDHPTSPDGLGILEPFLPSPISSTSIKLLPVKVPAVLWSRCGEMGRSCIRVLAGSLTAMQFESSQTGVRSALRFDGKNIHSPFAHPATSLPPPVTSGYKVHAGHMP